MIDTATIIAVLAILIAVTLFAALMRQTIRADRAEFLLTIKDRLLKDCHAHAYAYSTAVDSINDTVEDCDNAIRTVLNDARVSAARREVSK